MRGVPCFDPFCERRGPQPRCLIFLPKTFPAVPFCPWPSLPRTSLHILFPVTQGQLAQGNQFLDLAGIGTVCQPAGSAGISQTQGDVVLPANAQKLIKTFIKGILLAGHFHPGKDDGAASGHDIGQPLIALEFMRGFFVDAAVNGQKINAVLCVHTGNIQPL